DADADELLLLAQKIPPQIRKRVLERPDAFRTLASLDDEALDRLVADADHFPSSAEEGPPSRSKAPGKRPDGGSSACEGNGHGRSDHPGDAAVKTPKTPQLPKRATASRKAKPDAADWRWTDPKTIKVNPKFQQLIPLQSRGEYLALSESIKAEGC